MTASRNGERDSARHSPIQVLDRTATGQELAALAVAVAISAKAVPHAETPAPVSGGWSLQARTDAWISRSAEQIEAAS